MTNSTRCTQGVFVSVDGPGGAGKTTLVQHLHQWLAGRGHAVHVTTEPSHGPAGQLARHSTDTYRGRALACLVAADRYHHLTTEIEPALRAGQIVLSDRYVASSYVLQRLDGVPLEFVAAVNADVDRPDLAVILTADPGITAGRIANRGAHSRFETELGPHRREAELYRDTALRLVAAGYLVLRLESSTTCPDELAGQIGGAIERLMNCAGRPPTG